MAGAEKRDPFIVCPVNFGRGDGKGGKGTVAEVPFHIWGTCPAGFCSGGGVLCLQLQLDIQSFASALTPHQGVCGATDQHW